MIGDQKFNDIKSRFEEQVKAVPLHQSNDSNNYTQDSQDASGSTKSKTNNIQRNNSIRVKNTEICNKLEHLFGVKDGLKNNNDAAKCSISQPEKTDMPNKILSNNTNITIPELMPSLPPPPPPPPPCNSSYMMQRVTSKTTGDNNLNTPIISAPYEQQKPNIIRIYNTPTQVKIFVQAGGKTIIEIHPTLDIEVKLTACPRIQSKNEDIISDNCSTDSAGSDSGYDALSGVSGSASDFSC